MLNHRLQTTRSKKTFSLFFFCCRVAEERRTSKMALNNKVRNRFFHVTQFTMAKKWHNHEERKEKKTRKSCGTWKNFYHFHIHPQTNNNILIQLNQILMSFSAFLCADINIKLFPEQIRFSVPIRSTLALMESHIWNRYDYRKATTVIQKKKNDEEILSLSL